MLAWFQCHLISIFPLAPHPKLASVLSASDVHWMRNELMLQDNHSSSSIHSRSKGIQLWPWTIPEELKSAYEWVWTQSAQSVFMYIFLLSSKYQRNSWPPKWRKTLVIIKECKPLQDHMINSLQTQSSGNRKGKYNFPGDLESKCQVGFQNLDSWQ